MVTACVYSYQLNGKQYVPHELSIDIDIDIEISLDGKEQLMQLKVRSLFGFKEKWV